MEKVAVLFREDVVEHIRFQPHWYTVRVALWCFTQRAPQCSDGGVVLQASRRLTYRIPINGKAFKADHLKGHHEMVHERRVAERLKRARDEGKTWKSEAGAHERVCQSYNLFGRLRMSLEALSRTGS